jgi:DNA repair exonuclease SbcCD ATPase subunit
VWLPLCSTTPAGSALRSALPSWLATPRHQLHRTASTPSQELVAAQAAFDAERSRAGESSGQLERLAAEHAALVAGLQAQLDAALKSAESASEAYKQQTYEMATAYRRADSAAKEASAARAALEEARDAARSAAEAAARDVAAAADEVRRSEEARGEAESRLAEVLRSRDALQAQLEGLLAGAAAAGEGGAPLPPAPTGEGLLEALEAARRDREYLEGRVALLMADVARLTRERNLARTDLEGARAEVGCEGSGWGAGPRGGPRLTWRVAQARTAPHCTALHCTALQNP